MRYLTQLFGGIVFALSLAASAQTPVKLTISSATASSVEKTGTEAKYAIDGVTTTRWSSAFSDPQWIYVDLGSIKSISSVKLVWEAANAKNYMVEGSNVATFATKTTLATKTNMAAGARADNVTGLTG
jgi:beta-glucosidase